MTTRQEKVKLIFEKFDVNCDGGLNRKEMAALVVAVNPRIKFSDEQINTILDEVCSSYAGFFDGERGLTCDGLMRTYDEGAGNADRDFSVLGLSLGDENGAAEASSSSTSDASRGKSEGYFYGTWKIVKDLENLVKRLKWKQGKYEKLKADNSDLGEGLLGQVRD